MLPNLLWPGRRCAAEQSGAGPRSGEWITRSCANYCLAIGARIHSALETRAQQFLLRYFRKKIFYRLFFLIAAITAFPLLKEEDKLFKGLVSIEHGILTDSQVVASIVWQIKYESIDVKHEELYLLAIGAGSISCSTLHPLGQGK